VVTSGFFFVLSTVIARFRRAIQFGSRKLDGPDEPGHDKVVVS
jgi:hypothetical protein